MAEVDPRVERLARAACRAAAGWPAVSEDQWLWHADEAKRFIAMWEEMQASTLAPQGAVTFDGRPLSRWFVRMAHTEGDRGQENPLDGDGNAR